MLNIPDLASARILVTGGTGFLGAHLLPVLLKAGAQVTCMVRRESAAKPLPQGVEKVIGDCLNMADTQKAAANQDIVIHMAALLFGSSYPHYLSANSLAAQNIAAAVKERPEIQKVVFVSSLAAAGPAHVLPGRNEQEPPQPVSAYGWSKLLAENILRGELSGKPVVIMRPSIIYGSGDRGLLPLFKSCARGVGTSPGLREFPVSMIHARDAATAIALGCTSKAEGIYHLSDGRAYTMTEVCKAMGEAAGRKNTLVVRLPLALMGASAALSSTWHGARKGIAGFFGKSGPKPPIWNMDKYREARVKGWLADSSRIRRELGFSPQTDLRQGMAEAVAGYRQAGLL